MPTNDLAPGFVLLHYTSSFADHKMTIPVTEPVYDFGLSEWHITDKGGTPGAWDTYLTTYVTALKAVMAATVEFTYAELFSKAVGAEPVYLATASLNIAGTSASAEQEACQVTWSYRDDNGARGRVVLLDTSMLPNQKGAPPSWINAASAGVAAYLVSLSSMVLSRNGHFPVNVPKVMTKTNDVLRRKYGLV